MNDGRVEQSDVYSDGATSYLRLLKAYKNDRSAALKSASWGKFQVMGDNHLACGEESVSAFIGEMCSGEKGQVKLFAGFIQSNPLLLKAAVVKDWENIANHYNGLAYKKLNYDSKLEQAYNDVKKRGTT